MPASALHYLGVSRPAALSLSNGHLLRVVAGLVKDVCDASVVLIEGHYVPTLPGGSSAGDVVHRAIVSGVDKVVAGAAVQAVGSTTADDARLRGATAIESLLVTPVAEHIVGSAAAADFVVAQLPFQLVFGAQAFNKIRTVPALDCVAISGAGESIVPGGAHAQVARLLGHCMSAAKATPQTTSTARVIEA